MSPAEYEQAVKELRVERSQAAARLAIAERALWPTYGLQEKIIVGYIKLWQVLGIGMGLFVALAAGFTALAWVLHLVGHRAP